MSIIAAVDYISLSMPTPRVVVGPHQSPFAVAAVGRGGCRAVPPGEPAEGCVWLDAEDVQGLRHVLESTPGIRWVQLPFAGVENFVSNDFMNDERIWTCAKGSYAEPVAEHALMLALAGMRKLPKRVRAQSWGEKAGISLYDAPVTILGGGGIARSLVALLSPFRAQVTVVRKNVAPIDGVARVVTTEQLPSALSSAQVVFIALSLTKATTGIISRSELAMMRGDAWLVNVARGRHVVTEHLVDALRQNVIGGAGLDVTDPEPLPDGHPLFRLPNCIVTPHSADTPEMIRPLLAHRIEANAAHFSAGEPLEGVVDVAAGY